MQALDPCDHFHRIFNWNTPSETDFSPLLAPQDPRDPSPFSAFSTALGSTPRKLREWKPTSWEFDPHENPGVSPLGWRTLELSPLIQAFLPATIHPDILNSELAECKQTEEAIDESQSSAFDTLDSKHSSFDTLDSKHSCFDMSTLSSTLTFSHPTKLNSRSQSRFHSTFQSMMSDSDSDLESKPPPKDNLLTQSTMDFLFGGTIPCDAETIGETIGETIWETIWENGENGENGETKHQTHASPWDTPKSHPKLWDPFEVADSIPTRAWGFVDPESPETVKSSS